MMTPTERAVFAPVAILFEGIAAKDAALIREPLIPEGSATLFREGRFIRMTLAELGDRLISITSSEDRFEERMHDPLIRIDNNIAVVWGFYTAYKNGKPDHCGSNLISLINEDGRWRIASITDTSRR